MKRENLDKVNNICNGIQMGEEILNLLSQTDRVFVKIEHEGLPEYTIPILYPDGHEYSRLAIDFVEAIKSDIKRRIVLGEEELKNL